MPNKKILGVNVHYRNTSTLNSKGAWTFWYLVWGGLTILSLWFGVRGYFREQAFLSRAELYTGTITDYELNVGTNGLSDYCPRIEFTTNAGEPVAVQGGDCPNRPDDSKIGQIVQVYIDPENPEIYKIKSSTTGYDVLIFGLIGAGFFGLFWIIPLLVAVFKRLTSPIKAGSGQASPPVDQELAMLERHEKNKR